MVWASHLGVVEMSDWRQRRREGLVIIPGVCIGTKWEGAYLSKVLGDRQALLQTI